MKTLNEELSHIKKIMGINEYEVDEMNIVRKDKGRNGQENIVYPLKNHPDKLIKYGRTAIQHAKIFQQYPEYFPIVYKIEKETPNGYTPQGDDRWGYIVIEKLDDRMAQIDICKLEREINNTPIGVIKFHNDEYYHKSIELINNLRKNDPNSKILKTYDRIKEIYDNTPMDDLHNGNFGYDKNGILKALDI